MEKNLWDEFDQSIDVDGLKEDVKNSTDRTFKQVDHGDYEVSVEKMELVSSKAGDPMVTIWFKVISEGEFKGSLIFLNQVITRGFQIHIVNELLRSMDTDLGIEFKSYKQYGELLMDVHEAINDKLEFALSYKEGKKGFSTFDITEVFETED
ncbi:MAG: DUF669 domain-containing protein [Raoultibacter sp.]